MGMLSFTNTPMAVLFSPMTPTGSMGSLAGSTKVITCSAPLGKVGNLLGPRLAWHLDGLSVVVVVLLSAGGVSYTYIYRSNTLAIRLLYIYQSCLRYGNTKMNYHAISLEVEERGRGRRFTTLRPCYYIWMLNPRISLTSPSSIGDHLPCQSSNRSHPFKCPNKTQFRQAIQFKT